MGNDEGKVKWSKREWFMVVLIVMLLQFVVQASAFVYSGRANALNYWSLVGTSVSIILALVAIIYSFVQNLDQQRGSASIAAQIERLRSVIGEANKSGDLFSSELKRLDEVRSGLQESLNLARESRSDLVAMGKKLDESQKLIQAISSKPAEPKPHEGHERVVQVDLSKLLARTSPDGAIALYACYLAHKKQLNVDAVDLAKNLKRTGGADYLLGYCVGLHAVQLVSLSWEGMAFKVVSFDEKMTVDIKNKVKARIDAFTNAQTDQAFKSEYSLNIDAVERFFGGAA